MIFKRNGESNKSKRGVIKRIILIFFMFLLFLIFNEIFAFLRFNKTEKIINIPEGSSGEKICNILKEEKLISSSFLFKLFIKFNKYNILKSGSFKLSRNMNYYEIANELNNSVKGLNGEKLVFEEGMDFFKFKKKYNNKVLVLNLDEVIKEINDEKNYSEFDFFRLLDKEKLKKAYYPMEGLIFPNTFIINKNETAKSVAKKILKATDKKINKIKKRIKHCDMSLWEILTLASIIQAETFKEIEMPRISSVFNNRLNINKRLESDVTAIYTKKIEADCKEKRLNYKPIKDNIYNTYKIKGLCNGPICAVTDAAIEAAINPSKEDYYYFYEDKKSGKISYTKTFEEHKKIYS